MTRKDVAKNSFQWCTKYFIPQFKSFCMVYRLWCFTGVRMSNFFLRLHLYILSWFVSISKCTCKLDLHFLDYLHLELWAAICQYWGSATYRCLYYPIMFSDFVLPFGIQHRRSINYLHRYNSKYICSSRLLASPSLSSIKIGLRIFHTSPKIDQRGGEWGVTFNK